jgi:hypothetical protein
MLQSIHRDATSVNNSTPAISKILFCRSGTAKHNHADSLMLYNVHQQIQKRRSPFFTYSGWQPSVSQMLETRRRRFNPMRPHIGKLLTIGAVRHEIDTLEVRD